MVSRPFDSVTLTCESKPVEALVRTPNFHRDILIEPSLKLSVKTIAAWLVLLIVPKKSAAKIRSKDE